MEEYCTIMVALVLSLMACNEPSDMASSEPSIISANQSGEYTFFHDGTSRKYILHVPDDVYENSSLVFFLHGYQGNASEYQSFLGFDDVADKHHFIVCYPQGSDDFQGTPHWNAGLRISSVDDVSFLTALSSKIIADNNIDENRVFVAGLSNGGFMSYTLMCEAPNTFRAMASIIGTISGGTYESCPYDTPKPILQLSGLDDDIVPIDGSMTQLGGWGGAPHMDEIINRWCETNSCSNSITELIGANTMLTKYTTADHRADIWYYKVSNFGHEWPTELNGAGINGSELIWQFFDHFD